MRQNQRAPPNDNASSRITATRPERYFSWEITENTDYELEEFKSKNSRDSSSMVQRPVRPFNILSNSQQISLSLMIPCYDHDSMSITEDRVAVSHSDCPTPRFAYVEISCRHDPFAI